MRTKEQAEAEVTGTYNGIKPMISEVASRATREVDATISTIKSKMDLLTDKDISKLMLKLSVDCYDLGYYMEHANIKAECAKAIAKLTVADEFNNAAGSNDVRKSKAEIASEFEKCNQIIYEGVSNILSTKLSEAHRVIDVLKSLQITRMSQNKTEVGRTRLNEEM